MKTQTFAEALGFTPEQVEQLSDKCSDISAQYCIGCISLKSEVSQILKEKFSYNELLMLSTEYILMVTNKLIEKNDRL
jgi:hypothetical protein